MTVTIELTQGQISTVDDEDADLAELSWYALFRSSYANGAYIAVRSTFYINGKLGKAYLHRLVLSRVLGRDLKRGECVDHINGSPLDNRRANLRLATQAENNRNRRGRSNNTSGFKGVSWHAGAGKWQAGIALNGKDRYLGLFDDPAKAARAYDAAAIELHGEFACLNFPEALKEGVL